MLKNAERPSSAVLGLLWCRRETFALEPGPNETESAGDILISPSRAV
jgi:hypothetical protein